MEVVNQEEAVEQQPQPMPESSITAMPSEEPAVEEAAEEPAEEEAEAAAETEPVEEPAVEETVEQPAAEETEEVPAKEADAEAEEIARPGSADEEDQLFQDVFAEGAEMQQAADALGDGAEAEHVATVMDVDQATEEKPAVAETAQPVLSDQEAGFELYKALVMATFQAAGVVGNDVPLSATASLDWRQQLEAFAWAAGLYEHREAVLAALRDAAPVSPEVPDEYVKATKLCRENLEKAGRWPLPPGALKGKRVFGHKSAVKFLQLPNLPEKANKSCTVMLKEDSYEVAEDGTKLLLGAIQVTSSKHALDLLEETGVALVLSLDDIQPGVRAIVSPLLADRSRARVAESVDSLEQQRKQMEDMVSSEPSTWRAFVKQDGQLLRSEASRKTIAIALEKAGLALKDLPTPNKSTKRKSATGEDDARDVDPDGSPQEKHQKEDHPGRNDENGIGPRGYATLLGSVFEELGCYSDTDGGWLETRKELLVYHHAAALNENRDAVIAAFRNEEGAMDKLPAAHSRAIEEVRAEVMQDLEAAGLKLKRIFHHDQVIKFHAPPKGLPVPKSSCVFLRERPQAFSDVLRKTPSFFRDVCRFRCQGNPLTLLEEQGLALVFLVESYSPRAFLLVSPLLDQPDLIAEHAGKPWAEIKEALKDHLYNFIAKDAEAWRSYIQHHGHTVTKDSLRIIQKVLKHHKPSAVEESKMLEEAKALGVQERLETLAMARAEAECRADQAWEAAFRHESQAAGLLEVEARAKEASAEAELLADANQELLHDVARVRKKVKMAKHKAAAKLAKIPELKGRVSDMKKECEAKAREAAVEKQEKELMKTSFEMEMKKKGDEHEELKNTHKELLDKAEAESEALEAEVAQAWEKVEIAKDKMKTDMANYKEKEKAQTATTVQVLLAEADVAKQKMQEAQRAHAQSVAEMEMKADEVKRLTASNVDLRTDAARYREDAETGGQAAASAREAEHKCREELAAKTEEVQQLTARCDEIRAEVSIATAAAEKGTKEAQERMAAAEANAAEARRLELQSSAELKANSSQVGQLTESCVSLSAELSKSKDSEALLVDQIKLSDEALTKARTAEEVALDQVKMKAEHVERVTAASVELRAEASSASERARAADDRVAGAEKAATASSLAEEAALAEVKTMEGEMKAALATRDVLKTEVVSAHATAAEAEARIVAAEAAAADSRATEVQAAAELKIKADEVGRLTAVCEQMEADKEETIEKATDAEARMVAAQQVANDAQRAEALVRAELQIKSDCFLAAQEANATHRAAALAARQEADEAKQFIASANARAVEADRAAKTAQVAEAAATSKCRAKVKEAASLDAASVGLRAEAAKSAEKAVAAEDKAHQDVAAAQVGEVRAQADLQVQRSEVQRLQAAIAQQAKLVGELRTQVVEVSQRAESEQRSAEEAKAQLGVALASTELSIDEIRLLAKNTSSAPVPAAAVATQPSSSECMSPDRFGDVSSFDLEQALLEGTLEKQKSSTSSASKAQPAVAPVRRRIWKKARDVPAMTTATAATAAKSFQRRAIRAKAKAKSSNTTKVNTSKLKPSRTKTKAVTPVRRSRPKVVASVPIAGNAEPDAMATTPPPRRGRKSTKEPAPEIEAVSPAAVTVDTRKRPRVDPASASDVAAAKAAIQPHQVTPETAAAVGAAGQDVD